MTEIPDEILDNQDDGPRLHDVIATVCENCLTGVPGQCHVPECLFCRFHIEDTPQPLRYLVRRVVDPAEITQHLIDVFTAVFDQPWSTVGTQTASPEQLAQIASAVLSGHTQPSMRTST